MSGIRITRLQQDDRPRWTELWRGYLDFYERTLPPEIYQHTWGCLIATVSPIRGFAARLVSTSGDGAIVGIVHYLYHAHAWSTHDACYLQDLFVDITARGMGAAGL